MERVIRRIGITRTEKGVTVSIYGDALNGDEYLQNELKLEVDTAEKVANSILELVTEWRELNNPDMMAWNSISTETVTIKKG